MDVNFRTTFLPSLAQVMLDFNDYSTFLPNLDRTLLPCKVHYAE